MSTIINIFCFGVFHPIFSNNTSPINDGDCKDLMKSIYCKDEKCDHKVAYPLI